MAQTMGPERPATNPTATPAVPSPGSGVTAVTGAAAAAALDQLNRPTAADEAYDHYLRQLHGLAGELRAGRLTAEELPGLRTRILAELRDAVLHTQPDPVLARMADLWRGLDLASWPDKLHLPGGAAPAAMPVDHRYALQWTSAELPNLLQMKSASAETGRLHVVNLTDPTASAAGGYAQAGVGVLVRPRHRLSRLTFRPEATFTFRHVIDTPSVPGTVPFSRAVNRGQVRLVAQRVNPGTGAFETDAQRSIALWSDHAASGSMLFSDSGAGMYPSGDPGLSVLASGADTFALWFIATVYVAKEDHYRSNRTLCQANLDCAVPAIWVEESPVL